MSRPERPAPPPLEGNDRVITGVITCGFVVALVVLLVLRGQLPHADRWWIWVAAFGTFLGLFGFVYVPVLKRQRERAAARRAQTEGPQTGTGQTGAGQGGADQRHDEREHGGAVNAETERANRGDGARRP